MHRPRSAQPIAPLSHGSQDAEATGTSHRASAAALFTPSCFPSNGKQLLKWSGRCTTVVDNLQLRAGGERPVDAK